MAKINYSIKGSKKGQPFNIYVRLRHKKTDLCVPIGKSIYKDNWSQTTQSVKQRLENDNLIDPFTNEDKVKLNDYLSRFKVYLLNEFNDRTGNLNTEWLKSVVEKFRQLEAGESPGGITVCDYIQLYIDGAKNQYNDGLKVRLNLQKKKEIEK
jgi:hypothetical protein